MDERFLKMALDQAREAAAEDEVPVGAVAVFEGEVVGVGRNAREWAKDPFAHAEMVALAAASKALGRWRLSGVTLYVTLEPCAMCAGALVNARVDRLVYGAKDPKAGAVDSLFEICTDPRLNHRLQVRGGVLAEEAGEILRDFFQRKREKIREIRRDGRAG